MIRTDIETIIMAAGSIPSTIVLRERRQDGSSDAPLRALSIQTGAFEAASISQGIDRSQHARPITHDLMLDTIQALGAKVERVEISRVDAPVFYARLILTIAGDEGQMREVNLDARPSDALALAVRANAPIYVEDDVMNRAGTVSYQQEGEPEDELRAFDQFVHTLSPDDF